MATAIETRGAGLLRLANFLSPAFPVGGFAYSAGLERAIHDGVVADAAGLSGWMEDLLVRGSLWNDAVLLAAAWRDHADGEAIAGLAELALALCGTAERRRESTVLGDAFLAAASAWDAADADTTDGEMAYPVAVGLVAGRHGLDLAATLGLYLNAAVNQAGSVAIRCGLIGQNAALAMAAALEDAIIRAADAASRSDIDALGGFAFHAEIMSLNHEIQHSRLFRS